MSAMSERHHEQVPEPAPRWTAAEFHQIVEVAVYAAWRNSGLPYGHDLMYHVIESAFRGAFPDRVPPLEEKP